MAIATDDRLERIEAQLADLTTRMGVLVDDAETRRRRRETWQELVDDAMPLAAGGLATVSAELEAADVDVADLTRLGLRLAGSADRLDTLLVQLDSLADFAADAAPLLGEGMAMATGRLADLDRRGYFAFARQAVGILDEIVTNYTEEDVAALGENVVLILDTVRQMTQPEVMGLLQSTASAIHDEAGASLEGPPPSMFALMRQLRDPQVRSGLQRVLSMLRSVAGTATPPEHTHDRGGS
jgi:uncharacterized protein YjgD (DUF1641 family)